MLSSPLSDITNAAAATPGAAKTTSSLAAGARATGATTVRRVRHNPYASLISPCDSVCSPLSAFSSPAGWGCEAATFDSCYPAYRTATSEASTPFLSYSVAPEDVNRSLFAASTAYAGSRDMSVVLPTATSPAVNAKNLSHDSSSEQRMSTAATPKRSVGRVYVDGRPVPVHSRRHTAEVTVALRRGDAAFSLPDVYAVFPQELETQDIVGSYVIVEGDRGEDMGRVTEVLKADVLDGTADEGRDAARDGAETATAKLPKVLRLATNYELMQFDELDAAEAEALIHCRACAEVANLRAPITIERAIFQFDRQKLTFQFTSEVYVDFKALTHMLHRHYRCRIWMDQLNAAARAGANADKQSTPSHSEKRRGGGAANGRKRH